MKDAAFITAALLNLGELGGHALPTYGQVEPLRTGPRK